MSTRRRADGVHADAARPELERRRHREADDRGGLVIGKLARISRSFCDRLRLLDSTPVPCGASRETARRSELAGWAAYGYCASHSRYFWGLRLYLLCAPDGMPISFCLAPANEPEREIAAAMLDQARRTGLLIGDETIIADKGFAGQEFEAIVSSLDAQLVRPDRKGEQPRFGKLGAIRPWFASDFVSHFVGLNSLHLGACRACPGATEDGRPAGQLRRLGRAA